MPWNILIDVLSAVTMCLSFFWKKKSTRFCRRHHNMYLHFFGKYIPKFPSPKSVHPFFPKNCHNMAVISSKIIKFDISLSYICHPMPAVNSYRKNNYVVLSFWPSKNTSLSKFLKKDTRGSRIRKDQTKHHWKVTTNLILYQLPKY